MFGSELVGTWIKIHLNSKTGFLVFIIRSAAGLERLGKSTFRIKIMQLEGGVNETQCLIVMVHSLH